MNRLRNAIGAFIVLALLAGGGVYARKMWEDEPLPPVFSPRTCCLFPSLDFEHIEINQPEDVIRRGYGLTHEAARPGKKCLSFEFGAQVITLLIADGRAARKWLAASAMGPAECEGLPVESIDVVGMQCYKEEQS